MFSLRWIYLMIKRTLSGVITAGIVFLSLLVFLAVGCAQPAPCANSDTRSAASEPVVPDPSLRVMTFNIRYGTAKDGPDSWPHRKDLPCATIRNFNPDVIGLQVALCFQNDFILKNIRGYKLVGAGRDDGRQVGDVPSVDDMRTIRKADLVSLDPGVKRLMHPHLYHVSLTQRLWDFKQGLVRDLRNRTGEPSDEP